MSPNCRSCLTERKSSASMVGANHCFLLEAKAPMVLKSVSVVKCTRLVISQGT